MFISPTEAVKMYDVRKPTLYKDMSDGKLSFTKDDRNRSKLNVAELDRLYEKRKGDSADFTFKSVKNESDLTKADVNDPQIGRQLKAIKEQIERAKDREIELLEQQIEQFKDQVENLNRNLDETREEHRIYVRLLEDKREEQGTTVTQWDQKFQALELQIESLQKENKLLITREEERKKRIEERRKQREAERKEQEKNRGLFSRLFG